MKRPGWSTGIPSDGHTKVIDTARRMFAVHEVYPHQYELVRIPDPPPLDQVSKPRRRRVKRRARR